MRIFHTSLLSNDDASILLFVVPGKVYVVSRSGRIEKSIDAHQLAVLSLNWMADGSAFVTG